MNKNILGISGSPIKNSNTDRIVNAVLQASGLSYEFIKLPEINLRGCVGCLKCAKDNVCKQNDDFLKLAPKVREAGALVIGAYTPYGSVDSFTKSFLERLFSLRHRFGLNRGKLAVVITTGIGRGRPGLHEANEQIIGSLEREGMQVIGRLTVFGNPPCLSCGYGDTCPMSSLPVVFKGDVTTTPDKFMRAEEQSEVWEQAQEVGRKIGAMLRNGSSIES